MSEENDKLQVEEPEAEARSVDSQGSGAAPAEDGEPENGAAIGSGVRDLEQELATAQAAADENWAKYLRAVAELDNVRKRAARDVENARRYGVEGLAAELLSVADSLEMALETGAQAPAESLLEGGRATLKQLQSAMEKFGITVVSPEGHTFDPEQHEAMSVQESATAEPNTVLAVVQRGYLLNGRLLRPARVIVAKEPEAQG
ncbi:MAG: nucleotide exchange factor GrpE [Gammaproteobacteria bacterium]|jgi:molecular chaperone GrpE